MPDIITGIMAGTSLFGASKSASAANKATAAGEASAALQYDIADRQMNIAEDQWQHYLDYFQPIEEQLAQQADRAPDYEGAASKASADTAQAFDKNVGITERSMGRYGVNPNSGRFAGMENQFALGRAAAEVNARNNARNTEDDKAWARKLATVELGKGLGSNASSALSGAASNANSSAQMQFGIANQKAQEASRGFQTFGQQLPGIINYGVNMMTPQNQGYTPAQDYNAGGGAYGLGFDYGD